MSTADKLNKLLETKQAIKQAIVNKGVEVADDTKFADYPSKISSIPMEGGDPYYENLYNQRTNNGTNMRCFFQYCNSPELDLSDFDTSNATNMYNMFYYCSVPELDLSNFDTSNVTSMQQMFYNCTSQIKLGNWDTSKVTYTNYMFGNFTNNNKYLDLSVLDFGNVTNAERMFDNCNVDYVDIRNLNMDLSKLGTFSSYSNYSPFYNILGTSLDLSNWDIGNRSNLNSLFYYGKCKKIDLTNWVTTAVTNMGNMFYSNNKLEELIIPDWDMANVTSSSNMLYSCSELKYVDVSRSNATTITKLTSLLPTKKQTNFGTIAVPEDTSQAAYDALIAKYWRPIGAAMTPAPTGIVITLESNSITIGDSTTLSISSCEPWYADLNKIEYVSSDESIAVINDKKIVSIRTGTVDITARIRDTQEIIGSPVTLTITGAKIISELDEIMPNSKTKLYITTMDDNEWNEDRPDIELIASDDSMATITEDNEVISTGVIGDIVIEARIIDTQEVVGTKTIVVSETDSYPNLIKFRAAEKPSTSSTIITVNDSGKKLSDLTYDVGSDIYSYDAGVPITSIRFDNYSNISELIKLNTSNITDMSDMFQSCNKLTSLDLSNFNTSNVTNMQQMFIGCTSLTELDLSKWDTSNVTNMRSMFSSCTSLTELDLSNFTFAQISSNVDISGMFSNCTSLHTLRLDNCEKYTIHLLMYPYSIDPNWPANIIEGKTRTIYCKESITKGYEPPTNWVFSFVEEGEKPKDPNGVPIYSYGEFYENDEITNVRVIVNESHVSLLNMFYSCDNLVSVNIEDWNTSNVTNMEGMFSKCNNLTSLDLSSFNTSNVTNMQNMFYWCNRLTSLDVSNWDTSKANDMENMFQNCESLISLDLSNFNTSNVTSMSWMFYGCNKLTLLDVSNFDTSNVTSMSYMFSSCNSLHTLRLDNCNNDTISKIITSKNFPTDVTIDGVTRTIYCKESNAAGLTAPEGWVFSYVPEGPALYVPGEFAMSDVTEVKTMVNESHTDLSEMFLNCQYLTSVNTEDWNTSNVAAMNDMFAMCYSLKTLDLSSFDTSNVTDMSYMFFDCESLEELDIRNFDLIYEENNVYAGTKINIFNMFARCNKLKVLHLENCSTATVVHLLESSSLPARGNNDGIMYMSVDAYQGAKHIVPSGWTIFTE